jgi:Flp pilus assembly protein TadG
MNMKLHNVNITNIADSIKNERGSALLMVLFSLVALFAFAVLAIDGAVLMTTKTQLQSAADAAALAGASGLIDGDQNTATSRCIEFASSNNAFQATMTPVVIDADDVAFPASDIVRVRTHRTAATGDALRTFFVKVIDSAHGGTSDMSAVASAQAFDVCSSRCLKP